MVKEASLIVFFVEHGNPLLVLGGVVGGNHMNSRASITGRSWPLT